MKKALFFYVCFMLAGGFICAADESKEDFKEAPFLFPRGLFEFDFSNGKCVLCGERLNRNCCQEHIRQTHVQAYDYVMNQFGVQHDLAESFFTVEHIKSINRILHPKYSDIRERPMSSPVHQLGNYCDCLFPAHGTKLYFEPGELNAKFEKTPVEDITQAWTVAGCDMQINQEYVNRLSAEEVERDLAWTKKHLFTFFPNQPEDFFQKNAFFKLLTASSKLEIKNAIKERLEELLAELQNRYLSLRKEDGTYDKDQVIELAASAHNSLTRLGACGGPDSMTGLVVMNAILRYSGLPAVQIASLQEYNSKMYEVLATTDDKAFTALLRKKVDEYIKADSAPH